MSDKTDKPSIPAWQQAQKPLQAEDLPSKALEDNKDADAAAETSPDMAVAVQSTTPKSMNNEQDQREQIRAFLQDAAVKDQSVEKKRAFLRSKDMPEKLIDEELGSVTVALDTGDFADFSGRAKHADTAEHQAPPPIITYPEFLANAHSKPPLITPTRVLATTYVAAATAVLSYAASTFIIKPMTAALTDARHELSTHSNGRIDELNDRLEKLVSQVPGVKEDDSDSQTSEPTELFSRDQGTQTAEAAAHNEGHTSKVTIYEPTATTKQAEKLDTLQKHLSELLAGAQKEGKAVEEREANVKTLRHYLDGLAYGSAGVNVWSHSGGQFGWEQTAKDQQKEKEKKADTIEDLKKEIRGVKGVLLSAKRFPAAGRQAPGPASTSQYSARRGVDAAA